MAVELTTYEQEINRDSFYAGTGGVYLQTRQYVYYEMLNSTTARVHVRQTVDTLESGMIWAGTNNHYRSRAWGTSMDSEYTQYSENIGYYQQEIWSGYYDISNSSVIDVVCYFDTYGGSYYVDNTTGIYVPASAFRSPPAVPSISMASRTDTSVTFNVAISSYGVPSSASGRYIEAELSDSATYFSVNRRYAIKTNVSSASITVDNSGNGNLNIYGNTRYYFGAYANNTIDSNNSSDSAMAGNTVVTLPTAPAASNFTVIDSGSASFDITEKSVGSYYQVQLQYRYKSANGSFSSWTNAGNAGNRQTRSVTLSGLVSNTAYTVEVRASSSAGYSQVASYADAFRTSKVIVAITSQTDADSQTTGKIDRTFNVSFSAISSPSTIYEYEYQYKKSSSSAFSTAVSGSSSSPSTTFVLTLDQSTTYDFRIRAKAGGEYGDYTTAQFTTSSYSPGEPLVSVRFNDVRSKVYVDVIPAGLVSSVSCTVSGGGYTLISQTKNTQGQAVTFSADLTHNGEVITPEDVSVFSITVTQRYQSDLVTVTSSFNTPWKIFGVVLTPDGARKNLIRVRVKKKDGTVTDGDYNNPFIVK